MVNYMKEVAKLLGVELDEKFFIVDGHGKRDKPYRLTKRAVEMQLQDGMWIPSPAILIGLCSGKYKIEEPPFKPMYGETYYTVYYNDYTPEHFVWKDSPTDYARLKCGLVFRDLVEAHKAKPRVYEELTGKEWKE